MKGAPLDPNTVIAWGRDVLEAEAQSLNASAKALDQSFVEAVKVILASRGKLVVTGLGKSGHIGKKLAATFASTGTASSFLHPSEAALTGRTDSSLAQLSQVVLDGRVEREACPLNLAPTTSTSVAMGIGDALAVAIMRAKGFEKHDFAAFHPDGSLGRQLSLVSQHMKTDLLAIAAGDDFHRVLEVITAHNYGIAGVLDEKKQLIGAITDGDLRRALKNAREKVFSLHAKDIMTGNPKTISADRLALDAVKMMEQARITSLFVKNDLGEVVGLIRMHDLLAAKVV
ncbi:MAG: CBS domain-containing protein [Proteobacteria bacterium]|nr:MAG: CBS domain-containing protein [Pseudomonadota bacterium]